MIGKDAYDRFLSREDVTWNSGAFNLGEAARRREAAVTTNPYKGYKGGGLHLHDSWLAGWADADQGINSEREYAELQRRARK